MINKLFVIFVCKEFILPTGANTTDLMSNINKLFRAKVIWPDMIHLCNNLPTVSEGYSSAWCRKTTSGLNC